MLNKTPRPKDFPRPEELYEQLKTRRLADSDAPAALPRQTGPLDADLGAPWVVELIIHGTPITVRMEVNNRIILGRSDVKANIYPDLDLTPYGGLEKGVSRQHAAIIAESDRLMIIDLESTNGTFVNAQRIQPNKPYRLRHGDDVHIGKVRIEVRMEVVPVHEQMIREQPWVRLHPEAVSGTGQHILLIEDNWDVADTLKIILTRSGYQVHTVDEMRAAYHAVTVRLPDAVVLDLAVNTVNALEICRYIQRLAHNSYVPIIVITDSTDRERLSEVMSAGVDAILGKPIGVNELVRTVSSLTQEGSIQGRSLQRHNTADKDGDAPASAPGGR